MNYNDVPHAELIKDNATIHIGSVFMFKEGSTNLFAFLHACERRNCTVVFDNEDLIKQPISDTITDMKLVIYSSIIEQPKFANDYMRYLVNYDKFQQEGFLNG